MRQLLATKGRYIQDELRKNAMKIIPSIPRNDITIGVRGLDERRWLIAHDVACPISIRFHPHNTSASARLPYVEGKQHFQRSTNLSHHDLQENTIQSQESNKVRARGCALIIILVSLLKEVWISPQYCITHSGLYLGSTQLNRPRRWQHNEQQPMQLLSQPT